MLSETIETQHHVALDFVLGRDHEGHWVVRESHGLCGGLFASKDDAIRYARSEGAAETNTIRIMSEDEEIDFSV